jgi:linoleate 10R-lipoxygenase
MSSAIFAFASIVTHSLFRTDYKNMNINNANSYLDLSPLYGDSKFSIHRFPHYNAYRRF